MNRPIKATLTRTREGNPLVVLNSQPFNGLEIRPDDLRLMAKQLIELAGMSEQNHFPHPAPVTVKG